MKVLILSLLVFISTELSMSADLKSRLTPLQFHVTQEGGTEKPFENEYWNNHREGIYVDVVSGEVLFSSKDKFDSGSGWPSFTKPIQAGKITTKRDLGHGMDRTEIKSKSGSHLGHVFDDGPGIEGKRYCVNSASLRFVSREKMKEEGYENYLYLFEKNYTPKTELATFGAGCFWGVEKILQGIKGVLKTTVGYEGGEVTHPNYEIVKTGRSGHAEVVQIEFDPSVISYKELLSYFWRLHDPTQVNRQGHDVGTQYRSVIFYHSEEQKKLAEESRKEFDASGVFKEKTATQIVPQGTFWKAEEYHQKYLVKNPGGYMCHVLRGR